MIQSIARQKSSWAKNIAAFAWQNGRVCLTASGVACCVIAIRMIGLLQGWELAALDQCFRLRPVEPQDDRIIIVGADESDLQRLGFPISDTVLANLLQRVQAAKPRAIGLDFYRDLPVGSGHEALLKVYEEMPNLVGIEQLKDREGAGVAPPPVLTQLGRVGFNNVVYDPDRKIRRALLYWKTDTSIHQSFALKLALIYLKDKGIQEEAAGVNAQYLQLDQAVFPQFAPNDGVYVRADAGAYQILANYRGPSGHFKTVSIQDLMTGRVSSDALRDRIVLIGSTATSLKDFSATPYSTTWTGTPKLMAGVELQANFISQILSTTLENRSLLKVWAEPGEWLWIWVWAAIGTGLSWRLRSPQRSGLAIGLSGLGLTIGSYLAFLAGWVVPIVPPLIALISSAIVIISYIAHSEEELKRTKEFLHRIINTIPDPVFVKDKDHRWIVLNEAYSRFLGKPINELVEKSDYDMFPRHEADVFWQQDDLVFKYEHELEHEEEFTNISGTTYQIATKRSLHKDAAGNLFLVGVIRDITERKTIEEKLRRTTEELSRSNAELRLSQDRLSYMANHDGLTGLPNRNLFYERLSQCLEWADINQQKVALLFLDLDGFKQINDTLGHGVGDVLLQAVAKRLNGCLRTSDTVARLGGDEFVIILPAIPNSQDVARVAEKILSTLSQAFAISGETISVTTSIGISIYPEDSEEIDSLIQQADDAMYQAKEQGKNQFVFITKP
ncbi:MAG: CHASE2 domain-containing protein [Leptolyngbyaceae cyanobacterium CSU_1_3]|nr:CHASE2 domain-containing protein [Leptolyngbyaceae cyanobacterium CSU_1_3]